MVPNIIICTLIMWGLTAIAVMPLSKMLFAKAVAGNPELSSAANSDLLSEETKQKLRRLQNIKFVQVDVLVMGMAGLIAGFAGYPLIGFAWKANAWPGLMAMIGASFLSYHFTGGSVRV